MNLLRWGWLVSLLGLTACAATSTPIPGARDTPGPALPETPARWVSVISFPNLYGYPATYRGEFRAPGQCEQAFRATVALLANHGGNGTVSPCAVGAATVEVPE